MRTITQWRTFPFELTSNRLAIIGRSQAQTCNEALVGYLPEAAVWLDRKWLRNDQSQRGAVAAIPLLISRGLCCIPGLLGNSDNRKRKYWRFSLIKNNVLEGNCETKQRYLCVFFYIGEQGAESKFPTTHCTCFCFLLFMFIHIIFLIPTFMITLERSGWLLSV